MKILRTVGILALVAGLALGSGGSALAKPPDGPPGGGQHSPGKPHGLFGEVSEIDEGETVIGDETFTLTTRRGEEVSVTATIDTKYKVPGSPPSDDINTISDGDWVAMNGTWDVDDFCPKKVHVVPGKGLYFHFVGTVTGTTGDASAGTILVDCKKVGSVVEFSVSELGTQYRPDDGATFALIATLTDPTVTVVASGWDATAGTATAKAIVLHDVEPDTTPPYTSGHAPVKDASGVPISTNIVVHVQDDGNGVDQATIIMTVEGSPVSPTITGATNDYTLTYDPTVDFGYLQEVNVTVAASDLSGNPMTTDSYSFTTEGA